LKGTGGLLAEQGRRLDALTERRGQSWLVWLRQIPEATKPAARPGLIERLNHVRAIGIDSARGQWRDSQAKWGEWQGRCPISVKNRGCIQ
jgi:hypothetical protein